MVSVSKSGRSLLRPGPHLTGFLLSGLLLGGVLLGGPLGPVAVLAQKATAPSSPADLRLEGSSLRVGDRNLRHPVREDELVSLLGPAERSRYRWLWPGRGVLAVPSETADEIEELIFVLCEGAPEKVRVGLFQGTVTIDGVELRCSRSAEETLEALPEDFAQPEGLDAFVHARRAGLEVVVTLSSWDGVLTLSVSFPDPRNQPPATPEVRLGSESPP